MVSKGVSNWKSKILHLKIASDAFSTSLDDKSEFDPGTITILFSPKK